MVAPRAAVIGRGLALLASGGLVLAVFLPWTPGGRLAVDLRLGVPIAGLRPTVGLALVAVAALPSLAALVSDAGWPRAVAALAAGALVAWWAAEGGGVGAGTWLAAAASVILLAAAVLRPRGRRPVRRRRAPGHRLLPHTGDVAVEAWGPTRVACLAEAVVGLVSSFADTRGQRPQQVRTIELRAAADEDVLVELLGEVIYLADAEGLVAVIAEVEERPDGGFAALLGLVPIGSVELLGAAPKAITYHDLWVRAEAGGWRCHVTVDV